MPNLVLTHDSLSVKLESESLVITRKAESPEGEAQRSHVPLFDLDRVIVLGRPEISTPVLHKFMKSGIPVSFLSAKGHWIGCLHPDKDMDAGRRICQYETARDKTLALKVATRIVGTKICNARRVLQRLSSTRGESVKDIQVQASLALDNLAAKGMQAESVDALRGYEGAAAAVYFSRLSSFFPPDVPFLERSRRPPGDAANALLSWTYAIVLGRSNRHQGQRS
jgi:CRISPR-associated protein Cas1